MDWNFADANTQELTHGLCYYPARMVPQIAARLLETYCKKPGVIVDPFAGSGTTILESLLRHHRVIGIDVNPVAIYLARAKCTPLDQPIVASSVREHVNEEITTLDLDADPIYLQAKQNIDYWYDRRVAARLLALRLGIIRYLESTGTSSQQWVLWITLMGTIYACSRGIQDGSSFHTRNTPPNPQDPFQVFDRKLKDNLERVADLATACTKQELNLTEGTLSQILNGESPAKFNLSQGNALTILQEIPSDTVTGIVTSPPYGDEHSTINYTRYTKHAAYWLGISPSYVNKMSGETLSSRKQDALPTGIPTTELVLAQIKTIKASDHPKVVHFLSEFYQCLKHCQRILTTGAVCAIVIANRRVRNVEIPMDTITTELASQAGLQQESIFYRTFPKKVVAWRTISGKSMDQENIVILRK